VKGVEAGRAEVRWWLRAPSGVPVQGRRVRVVGGCYGRGEPRREAVDGGAHRRGTLGGGKVEAAESSGEGNILWWRSATHGSGRWSRDGRSLGWHRRSTSVAGGG
jgi:hypothetical protein